MSMIVAELDSQATDSLKYSEILLFSFDNRSLTKGKGRDFRSGTRISATTKHHPRPDQIDEQSGNKTVFETRGSKTTVLTLE